MQKMWTCCDRRLLRAVTKGAVYDMTYCISDLHGRDDRFREMLEFIGFSASDVLYIIGDVIDRNRGGVEILRMIMKSPNMVLLKGNHEQMCLDAMTGPFNPEAEELWAFNGGGQTRRELAYHTSAAERGEILRFLASLPEELHLTVAGKNYILVHAAPGETREERLWTRPEAFDWSRVPADALCIIGHTPTCFLTGDFNSVMRVYEAERYLCIDCGCGHNRPTCRPACLRLDDMAVFYGNRG